MIIRRSVLHWPQVVYCSLLHSFSFSISGSVTTKHLADHLNFFEGSRRLIDHEGFNHEHFPNSHVKVYDINMVAEREPPEPPRRRARGDVTSMDVDLPDDDDELGEAPAAATTPPLPTPTESIAAAAPSIVRTPPPNNFPRRSGPKLLDKPDAFDGTGTSWRIWKLRATGWLSAVDVRYRHLLPAAERSEAILDLIAEEVTMLDTFLYTQLLVWWEGDQLEMLLRGPESKALKLGAA